MTSRFVRVPALWLASAFLAGFSACSSTNSSVQLPHGPTPSPSTTPSATPTATPTPRATPTATPACKSVHGEMASSDGGPRETIVLPEDCGNALTVTIPRITETGSSYEFGMNTVACADPQPSIHPKSACMGTSEPPVSCAQPASTFWALTLRMHARIPTGSGGTHIRFDDDKMPIVFHSSAFVIP